MNKSEIFMDEMDEREEADQIHQEHEHQQHETGHAHSLTLVCVYEDVIKSPKDQIKWYFNKHRIRSALDDHRTAHMAGSTVSGGIKILNQNLIGGGGGGGDEETSTSHRQFSSSFSPNHHYTITQTLSDEQNSTVSTLTIHNFNLKYNYGRYRCQYKGLIKTVKIFPNHRNGMSTPTVNIFSLSIQLTSLILFFSREFYAAFV